MISSRLAQADYTLGKSISRPSNTKVYHNIDEALAGKQEATFIGRFTVLDTELNTNTSYDHYRLHEKYAKGFPNLSLCLHAMLEELGKPSAVATISSVDTYMFQPILPSTNLARFFPNANVVSHDRFYEDRLMDAKLTLWESNWEWKPDFLGVPKLVPYISRKHLQWRGLSLGSDKELTDKDYKRLYGTCCERCGGLIEENRRFRRLTLCARCDQEIQRDIDRVRELNQVRTRRNYLTHLNFV